VSDSSNSSFATLRTVFGTGTLMVMMTTRVKNIIETIQIQMIYQEIVSK